MNITKMLKPIYERFVRWFRRNTLCRFGKHRKQFPAWWCWDCLWCEKTFPEHWKCGKKCSLPEQGEYEEYRGVWACISMHDDSGRRGVWIWSDDDYNEIQIISGREGDDNGVKIVVGEVIDKEKIYRLYETLCNGNWMLQTYPPNKGYAIPELHSYFRKDPKVFIDVNKR